MAFFLGEMGVLVGFMFEIFYIYTEKYVIDIQGEISASKSIGSSKNRQRCKGKS